jgi:hypothetical protein
LKACIPFSEYNKSASDKMPLQRRQRCPFRWRLQASSVSSHQQ